MVNHIRKLFHLLILLQNHVLKLGFEVLLVPTLTIASFLLDGVFSFMQKILTIPQPLHKIFERINHFMDRIPFEYSCASDYGIATTLIVISLFVLHFWVQYTGQQIHIFALKPDLLRYHFLEHWTDIFTHSLFHINFVHLLLNAVAIIIFGAPVEASIGTLRYILLYAVCSIFASIFVYISWILEIHFCASPRFFQSTVGISGFAYSNIAIYCHISRGYFGFVFIEYFSALFLGWALEIPISNFGHLGGIVAAYLYLRGYFEFFMNSKLLNASCRCIFQQSMLPYYPYTPLVLEENMRNQQQYRESMLTTKVPSNYLRRGIYLLLAAVCVHITVFLSCFNSSATRSKLDVSKANVADTNILKLGYSSVLPTFSSHVFRFTPEASTGKRISRLQRIANDQIKSNTSEIQQEFLLLERSDYGHEIWDALSIIGDEVVQAQVNVSDSYYVDSRRVRTNDEILRDVDMDSFAEALKIQLPQSTPFDIRISRLIQAFVMSKSREVLSEIDFFSFNGNWPIRLVVSNGSSCTSACHDQAGPDKRRFSCQPEGSLWSQMFASWYHNCTFMKVLMPELKSCKASQGLELPGLHFDIFGQPHMLIRNAETRQNDLKYERFCSAPGVYPGFDDPFRVHHSTYSIMRICPCIIEKPNHGQQMTSLVDQLLTKLLQGVFDLHKFGTHNSKICDELLDASNNSPMGVNNRDEMLLGTASVRQFVPHGATKDGWLLWHSNNCDEWTGFKNLLFPAYPLTGESLSRISVEKKMGKMLRELSESTSSFQVGNEGQSCTTVCSQIGLTCSPNWFPMLNDCSILREAFPKAERCIGIYGFDIPAWRRHDNSVMINFKPFSFPSTCGSLHVGVRRLCPCSKNISIEDVDLSRKLSNAQSKIEDMLNRKKSMQSSESSVANESVDKAEPSVHISNSSSLFQYSDRDLVQFKGYNCSLNEDKFKDLANDVKFQSNAIKELMTLNQRLLNQLSAFHKQEAIINLEPLIRMYLIPRKTDIHWRMKNYRVAEITENGDFESELRKHTTAFKKKRKHSNKHDKIKSKLEYSKQSDLLSILKLLHEKTESPKSLEGTAETSKYKVQSVSQTQLSNSTSTTYGFKGSTPVKSSLWRKSAYVPVSLNHISRSIASTSRVSNDDSMLKNTSSILFYTLQDLNDTTSKPNITKTKVNPLDLSKSGISILHKYSNLTKAYEKKSYKNSEKLLLATEKKVKCAGNISCKTKA